MEFFKSTPLRILCLIAPLVKRQFQQGCTKDKLEASRCSHAHTIKNINAHTLVPSHASDSTYIQVGLTLTPTSRLCTSTPPHSSVRSSNRKDEFRSFISCGSHRAVRYFHTPLSCLPLFSQIFGDSLPAVDRLTPSKHPRSAGWYGGHGRKVQVLAQ